MAGTWPRRSILGLLVGWYVLVNCMIPLFHRCDATHHACKIDGRMHGATKAFCPAHDRHHDHGAEPSRINEGALTPDRAAGHLCLICAYLYKSKWATFAPIGLLAEIHNRSRSVFVCVGTCHMINRPWSTSIILRAPPISTS
jgi:hypothetical protein